MALRISCLLLWCLAVAPAVWAQPAKSFEAWQTSWEAFVGAYGKCAQDVKCDAKRFAGKEVVWEGTVVDSGTTEVRMNMGAKLQRVEDGVLKSADILGFVLKHDTAQQEKWNSVAKGRRVRFKTKLVSQFRPDAAAMWMDVPWNQALCHD